MTMADCSELKESIADAQRLLQYASIKGIEVPPDLLAQIVGAQALSITESEDPATFKGQEEFWSALSKLSVLTKPATTDSVRHAAASKPDRWATLWARISRSGVRVPVQTSTSELAVRKARFWALVGLLLVAIFQSYYEVGQSTATKYTQASTVVAEERMRGKELTEARSRALLAKAAEFEISRIDQEHAKSRLKIAEASEQTERRGHWMKAMLFWHQWPAIAADDPQAASAQTLRIQGILEGWLALLRNFVLPIAWSFLGAALYVSRALAEDIRGMAYAPERAILHRSRYYMGMVAGFVAAKFFPTSAGVDFGEVTPFAVALLVGYSVEVLFALLDKLIGAFSTK
ncbi:hypothetical protein ACN9MJ_13160 [Acidovorax facilis]|uniref:hypothetical protein n=1 Tax=Acidovorax facilis TaxID=12917 RepID=UPI003CF607D6